MIAVRIGAAGTVEHHQPPLVDLASLAGMGDWWLVRRRRGAVGVSLADRWRAPIGSVSRSVAETFAIGQRGRAAVMASRAVGVGRRDVSGQCRGLNVAAHNAHGRDTAGRQYHGKAEH